MIYNQEYTTKMTNNVSHPQPGTDLINFEEKYLAKLKRDISPSTFSPYFVDQAIAQLYPDQVTTQQLSPHYNKFPPIYKIRVNQ